MEIKPELVNGLIKAVAVLLDKNGGSAVFDNYVIVPIDIVSKISQIFREIMIDEDRKTEIDKLAVENVLPNIPINVIVTLKQLYSWGINLDNFDEVEGQLKATMDLDVLKYLVMHREFYKHIIKSVSA